MRTQVIERATQFANNRDVNAKFVWETIYMYPVAAIYQTAANKNADIVKMKECRKLLAKYEGAFSNFRNNMKLPVITKMSLAENPEEYIQGVQEVYRKLHKIYAVGSEYMVLAAMMIYDNKDNRYIDDVIDRTDRLIKAIKSSHPFITSKEDMAMITMLALTQRDENVILEDVEKCYQLLKNEIAMHSNSLQSLAIVLATSDKSAEEKVSKTLEISRKLAENGKRIGKGNELASLGTCGLLDASVDEIVDAILEAEKYLKGRKGFGNFVMGQRTRLVYSSTIASDCLGGETDGVAAVSAAITAAIAASVAIMCAVIASTSAANSAH